MKSRLNVRKWGFLILSFTMISGCATLNEEECQMADWQAIGYEDGVKGAGAGRIGKHRSACAKHGVTPNFEHYQAGRAQGLRVFCQPGNGFRIGHSGRTYSGICPVDLEPGFLNAYSIGREIYLAKSLISKMKQELEKKHQELHLLDESLHAREAQLVGKHGSFTDRAHLLLEIKDMNQAQGQLEAEIIQLEKDIAMSDQELMMLTTRHGY